MMGGVSGQDGGSEIKGWIFIYLNWSEWMDTNWLAGQRNGMGTGRRGIRRMRRKKVFPPRAWFSVFLMKFELFRTISFCFVFSCLLLFRGRGREGVFVL